MTQAQAFDLVAFKQKMRQEWSDAAAGWRKWYHVVEGEEGGQRHSAILVELARVRQGTLVLDVGGGYGEPSLTAARIVGPKGRAVCTDISPGLLAFAHERAKEAGLDDVELIEQDAEQLDFEEESFDAIVSRAVLMFLPDVAGTLTRLRSFLKPGGRFAASVWGEKSKVEFAMAGSVIAAELALPPPTPGLPGIFALADERRLAALVREAGFRDVETGTVQVIFETETAAQFTEFIRDVAPPFSVLLKDQPPEVRERIWEKVTKAYARCADPSGRIRTTNEAIWVAATK
ncbi:MAG: methyltransferase domain-containing protein [Rhizobiales bacterium]|nr:methyltransferase domain-containing protein [Hyphomicrobiales bacterium]